MFKLLHLNYHYHSEFTQPKEVIALHKFSCGFIDFIKQETNFVSVKHLNYEGHQTVDNINYLFFKSKSKFWYIPFNTHRFIKKQNVDVVLTEGFIFPLQIIFLRWKLGRKVIIIAQHQGDQPFRGIKKFFQRWANQSIDAYLFHSIENAKPWIDKKIISNQNKCFEVWSASTSMTAKCKEECKQKLGFSYNQNFLWVGRLIGIKDPITVLKAFAKYVRMYPEAKLYMIYQAEDLLDAVKKIIADEGIESNIVLAGKKENRELVDWYSAADYFILGSHREGSGYALAEAMCCGCIPLVTNIPSFQKLTNNGRLGFLFEKGNSDDAFQKMLQLKIQSKENLSKEIMAFAQKEFSFETVSNQILDVCNRLLHE